MTLRVGLGQIEVFPGDVARNLATVLGALDEFRSHGVDLAVFPELCVSGYLVGDRWHRQAFVNEIMEANHTIAAASGAMTVVWGSLWAPSHDRPNRDGRRRLHNAGLVAQGGHYVPRPGPMEPGVTAKTLLPDYRIFEDSRHFFSLLDLAREEGLPLEAYARPFTVRVRGQDLALGVEICEDLWFGDYFQGNEAINVTRILRDQGADLVLNLSASPWTRGKTASRHRRAKEAMDGGRPAVGLIYVNCVGVQNNGKNFVTFDGASSVYDGRGVLRHLSPRPWTPALEVVTLDLAAPGLMESPPPVPETLTAEEEQRRAAVTAIRSLDTLMGRTDWPMVIGLSGGIDSAVSTCLAVEALGPERVRVFTLPSRHNSAETLEVAARLARELGLNLETIPIEPLVESHENVLEAYSPQSIHRENIQAKIRGTSILSNLAGILGGVMCNNGNKVELALGYATLYGDVNGAISPLGDLLKTEVFALARHYNDRVHGREVISRVLLPDEGFNFILPPTAELKAKQRDPMKWGYHDALLGRVMTYRGIGMEEAAEWWLAGSLEQELGLAPELLETYGLRDAAIFVQDLEWFFRLFSQAVFKRIQAPPLVIMSRSAFGYDYRESQLPHRPGKTWSALREAVLRQGSYRGKA